VLWTVRFGDDSVAQIKGRGTVAFVCKTGETRSFSGVYFIPRLTTNIVTIGQLEEVGYKIDINTEVMQIKEPGGRLLAKVMRAGTRLYVLNIKLALLSCLARCDDEEAWRWHAHLGHVNMAALRKLAREELVWGLPEIGQVERVSRHAKLGSRDAPPSRRRHSTMRRSCWT
jgi:hypothetical protein